MRRIIVNESQFKRLMEVGSHEAPTFDGGDIKEYPSHEVFTTSNVSTDDEDLKYGDPTTADDIQQTMTPQNYWYGRNGARLMP